MKLVEMMTGPEAGDEVIREIERANESAASGRFEDHLEGQRSHVPTDHSEARLLDFSPKGGSRVEMNVCLVEDPARTIFEAANEQG